MTDEELRKMLSEATPGPWRAGTVETDAVFVPNRAPDAWGPERVILRMNRNFPFEADCKLIAAAPELATEVLRLRSALRYALETIEDQPVREQALGTAATIRCELGSEWEAP